MLDSYSQFQDTLRKMSSDTRLRTHRLDRLLNPLSEGAESPCRIAPVQELMRLDKISVLAALTRSGLDCPRRKCCYKRCGARRSKQIGIGLYHLPRRIKPGVLGLD